MEVGVNKLRNEVRSWVVSVKQTSGWGVTCVVTASSFVIDDAVTGGLRLCGYTDDVIYVVFF